MEKFLRKFHWLIFAAIATFLIYPSFQKGYIFALDWTIKPFITFSDIKLTDPLGWVACDFLSVVFTFGVFQRIFLFTLIFLAGLAGFRLAKGTNNLFAQYFAGLLLIFNPFIYARIIEQTMIVGAGVIAFFWFLVFFKEHLEEDSRKKLIYSALAGALAVSFFAHSIFFIGAVFVVLSLFEYLKKKNWKILLQRAAFFWLIILSLNSNWAIASFSGTNTWASNVKNFTSSDLETFQTQRIAGNSIYFTVLSLQGYWGEYQDRFVQIQENPLWEIAFYAILSLSVFGLIKIWQKDYWGRAMLIVFAIAYILAIGIASPLTKPLAMFFYEKVPFYVGLREPQKWVAVMVFAYAYLAGWGIKYFLDIKSLKNYRKEIGAVLAILPVIFSFSAIQGMHEHFTPHEFPGEWQEAKNFLDKNNFTGKTLFFPWHSYLEFDFAGKNIVNPAEPYFGKNTITGNNIEFGKVYSNFKDDRSLTIQKYAVWEKNPASKINFADFSVDMKNLGVKEVILAKAEDWRDYAWLDTIELKKTLENGKLIIYEIK